MLREFFVEPAAGEQLRSCLFGAHLDLFCVSLCDVGYPRETIRQKLWIIGRFSRWMAAKHLAIVDLDERRVEEFIEAQQHRPSRRGRGVRPTLLRLLEQLREAGAVPASFPVGHDSPGAALIARYVEHLRRERALADSTIAGYLGFVQAFVAKHLDGKAALAESLSAGDVRDFLLVRVKRMAPKRAQYMATALRSFFGFLFLRGETISDLSRAVPTVRQGRQVGVPRHMAAEDIERLIGACSQVSATGRRDHALLLLLARLGLRACEVMALKLEDVRWRDGEIIVRGKGLIQDRLPLPTDVGLAITLYLQKDRPPGPSRHVFLCRKAPHRGFSHPSTVSTIVARALARAGLSPATRGAHLLRHSLATTMVRQGASFVEIGQLLRHRSPNTTEIYAKLDFAALRDVAMPWPVTQGAR